MSDAGAIRGDLPRQRLEALIQLYRLAFGRSADPGGLQSFFAFMQGGGRLEQVAEEFVNSGEFLDKHPGGPTDSLDLVEALYAAAFGPETARDVITRYGAALAPIAGLGAKIAALAELAPGTAAGGTIAFMPNDPAGYQVWIAWNESGGQVERPRDDAPRPLISVILPVDGNCARIRAAIPSVRRQSYGTWELLLLGWPSLVAWTPILKGLWRDRRLRLIPCLPGQSAEAKLQAALRSARGEVIGFLGAADALHPTCFSKVADALDQDPRAALVYADEDVLQPDGGRRSPWFKSSWDQEAATTLDQIGRCWFASVSRLRSAASGGALDPPGLAQRLALKLAPSEIVHIPAVLYHRFDAGSGPDSAKAGGAISVGARDNARIAPAHWPTVSIIVPTRDRADLLEVCLAGLLECTDYPAIEVIVVDNNSREPETHALLARVREDPRVRVLAYPGPFNWGAINNFAAASASGDVILLLNNDIEVFEPGWLRELVVQVMRPEVGVVGATLLYPDRTIQHAGIAFGPDATAGHVGRGLPADAAGPGGRFRVVRGASAVTGACMAIRREVYRQMGGVEEIGLRVTWSDSDLCLKAWSAGYRVLVSPFARLVHVELATRGSDTSPEAASRYEAERAWMHRRWGARLDSDPFHSPHLDAETGALRLAEPGL